MARSQTVLIFLLLLGASSLAKAKDVVLSPQLSQGGDDESLSLTGGFFESVTYTENFDPKTILKILSPKLEPFQLAASENTKNEKHSSTHLRYDILFNSVPVYNSYLVVHFLKGNLSFIRASLPSIDEEPKDKLHFRSLSSLGYRSLLESKPSVSECLYVLGSHLVPAWQVVITDYKRASFEIYIISAESGEILERRKNHFDATSKVQIFKAEDQDGDLVTETITDLKKTSYLDGDYFSVYAPDKTHKRASSDDGEFVFSPVKQRLEFDQTQVYYAASRALTWFQTRFGFKMKDHLNIRINYEVDGNKNTAIYVPESKEILLGPGDGENLRNLARDSDVIIHEFSHHIIQKTLKGMGGESGALHEGMADYFAYALNGDPNLAESVKPKSRFLRTAKLAKKVRFDDPNNPDSLHYRGQIWSAVLWSLRQDLGESFDEVVFNSLSFLGSYSGFADAILGLLSADLEVNSENQEASYLRNFGPNKCDILDAVIKRGFGLFLEKIDGSDCGLDTAKLAKESNDKLYPPKDEGKPKMVLGKPCGVLAHGFSLNFYNWFLLLGLLIPLAEYPLVLFAKIKISKNTTGMKK